MSSFQWQPARRDPCARSRVQVVGDCDAARWRNTHVVALQGCPHVSRETTRACVVQEHRCQHVSADCERVAVVTRPKAAGGICGSTWRRLRRPGLDADVPRPCQVRVHSLNPRPCFRCRLERGSGPRPRRPPLPTWSLMKSLQILGGWLLGESMWRRDCASILWTSNAQASCASVVPPRGRARRSATVQLPSTTDEHRNEGADEATCRDDGEHHRRVARMVQHPADQRFAQAGQQI